MSEPLISLCQPGPSSQSMGLLDLTQQRELFVEKTERVGFKTLQDGMPIFTCMGNPICCPFDFLTICHCCTGSVCLGFRPTLYDDRCPNLFKARVVDKAGFYCCYDCCYDWCNRGLQQTK